MSVQYCHDCGIHVDTDHDCEHFDENGECTANFEDEAIAAGIPKSVVDGKTKLSDHFSKEYINYKCNNKEDE